ncbi:hypothetical protein HPP92_005448 [Vanilla planifolia]|uniref:WD repeat-containing protein 44 n=1 Tax=Vanilla planifolia TaxID=51239 RepID=A0A835RGU1_VANPL|nr:hypothetical protein HPP92_005448 [Vanilla planifolia]
MMGRPCDAEVDVDLVALVAAGEGFRRERKTEGEEKPCDHGDGEQEEEEGGEDGDDDDEGNGGNDCFFESLDRVPSGVSFDLDLPSSGSESEEEDEDVRISFASAIEAPRYSVCIKDLDDCFDDEDESAAGGGFDYGIWMAEPISLTERRRRLLQGMGLTSSKDLAPSVSRREPQGPNRARIVSHRFPPPLPPPAPAATPPVPSQPPKLLSTTALVRCRSDNHLAAQSPAGDDLVRSLSSPPSPWLRNRAGKTGVCDRDSIGVEEGKIGAEAFTGESHVSHSGLCMIKNLDTGKEFVVSEVTKDGFCGRLNDVQTGMQLTMDEFERFLGFSPIVKELMRRANLGGGGGEKKNNSLDGGKNNFGLKGYGVKSSKSSGRKRVSWLKNIKSVASSVTGFISEKEKDHGSSAAGVAGFGGGKHSSSNGSSSDWLKVRQHGKSYKELTGLYMCQEIQAHEGSIWCMKFSCDGRFVASAGEDRTVHVWQVIECDTFSTFSSLRRQESRISANVSSLPLANGSVSSRIEQSGCLSSESKRMRKISKSGSRKRSLPDYIVLPETIFSLSEKPVYSFEGHLDDVLDLSWSKSQHLLSSSMDKTVRLWDMENRACLKLFAHNDYVTCIQFNPIDNNSFISGSLDAKVRIWSISERQVVDWSDLHEMVTAVCYTPDGQGALVGSHKGSFRFYNTADDKLCQETQIDIRNKKKKSHAKKITGFQYAPDNPSEVMVTSADSLIRVFDGPDVIHKFRGFRNTSSQISASFTSDGKYVVCASEDSHVYIWKRDPARSSGAGGKGKTWVTTRSHEYFYCKDVSVAVPWPNIGSNCEKPTLPSVSSANLDDPFPSDRSQCPPPLPPRKASSEQLLPTSPDWLRAPSRSGSGLGGSSPSRSLRSSVNSSSSSSSFGSWGWGGGSNRVVASNPETANAWGLVVVTAGLGGNIRVYQNFGLPVRLGKQTNLF